MTIDYKELRAGNLVKNHKGEVHKVTPWDIWNFECMVTPGAHFDKRLEEWRYIPLDEEWAKRLGWNNEGYDPLWLTFDRYSETQWNTYLMGEHGEKYGNIRLIEYVHELQNLYFWITGKELTPTS